MKEEKRNICIFIITIKMIFITKKQLKMNKVKKYTFKNKTNF